MFVYGQDWDKDLSGGITVEQMREIFRIYKVLTTKYRFTICYCWSTGQGGANNNFDLYTNILRESFRPPLTNDSSVFGSRDQSWPITIQTEVTDAKWNICHFL